ncbi:MAG: hypothetical protein IRZ07_06490 [Microbispora sp.]|nr:hypothetical protein [Microbispora sp.]
MAYHVAELMDRAERGPPQGRAAAAAECREAVLALWRHRYCLEVGRRPFEAFVPLAETLAERGNPWERHRSRALGSSDVVDDSLLVTLREIDVGANAAAELVTSLIAARLNSEETMSDLSILSDAETVSPGDPDVLVVRFLRKTSDLVLSAEAAREADRKRIAEALDLLAVRAADLANEARRVSEELAGGGPPSPGAP